MSPISLDELNQRASLLNRLDRKYILPARELPVLMENLCSTTRILTMNGRTQFGYRSSYFDSSTLDCYLDAAHRRRRFKLRIRTYLDTTERFLEIKTRGYRGRTVKQRTAYSGEDQFLDRSARAYSGRILAASSIHRDLSDFSVVLTTDYQRTTLFVPATGSRITIDTHLRWSMPGGHTISLPGMAVVETKSARASPQADRLLWSLRHRPCSVSKYGTGLAALRPDLPSHHWRPVLRRHFHHNEM